MTDLSKNSRPRWGSDWDADLGYVIIFSFLFIAIASIIWALAFASVQNNRGNVARDNYYAQHCSTVSTVVGSSSNATKVYNCQSK